MEKVLQRYDDQHVDATIVYVDDLGKAYWNINTNDEMVDAIAPADLERLFMHGLILSDGAGAYYLPISCSTERDGPCTVTYIIADDTVATTAVLATAESSTPVVA